MLAISRRRQLERTVQMVTFALQVLLCLNYAHPANTWMLLVLSPLLPA